ncbi:MAG: putative methyltransferase [Paenibacillus sp.]|jgi:trans-aconitate methyltransferase|nr:putative methyltransferase [Paenibacillus sp.]
MATEKKDTFNEVAELYHRSRNHYPERLFDELVELTRLQPQSRALEIGCGTGIATLPMAKRGMAITAVERGADMAAVARSHLAGYPNVNVEVDSFESWLPPADKFDLVYSATAFHWLLPEVRYVKCADILRPGGYLAIIRYDHVAGGDTSFFNQVQSCYEAYMPGTPKNLRLQNHEDISPDTAELEASGLFELPVVSRYVTEETYTTEQYIDLLSTYSNHIMLDTANRERLFDCIRSLINRQFNGSITKCYLHEVILARKR